MKLRNFSVILFVLLVVAVIFSLIFSGCKKQEPPKPETPKERIAKKISELGRFQLELVKKGDEADRTKREYLYEIKKLKEEIHSEKNKQKIGTEKGALANKTIANDLSLLQYNYAYAEKLSEIMQKLEAAEVDIVYNKRKAEADLRIVNVLSGEDLDRLIADMDAAYKKYMLDAKAVINEKELRIRPISELWKEIMKEDAEKKAGERELERIERIYQKAKKAEEAELKKAEEAAKAKEEITVKVEVKQEDDAIKQYPTRFGFDEPQTRELLTKRTDTIKSYLLQISTKRPFFANLYSIYINDTDSVYRRILKYYDVDRVMRYYIPNAYDSEQFKREENLAKGYHYTALSNISLDAAEKDVVAKPRLLSLQKVFSMEEKCRKILYSMFLVENEVSKFCGMIEGLPAQNVNVNVVEFNRKAQEILDSCIDECKKWNTELANFEFVSLNEIWRRVRVVCTFHSLTNFATYEREQFKRLTNKERPVRKKRQEDNESAAAFQIPKRNLAKIPLT